MFPERLRSSPPLASQRVGDPLIMMGMITLMIMMMMVVKMVMMMGMIDNIKGDDNYTFILSADDNSEENDSVVDKIGHDFDFKVQRL